MNKELLEAMERDMRISPYADELEKYYISRMVYSGLVQWLRVATQDEIYGENATKSKIYLLNRGREILSYFVVAFPDVEDYFLNSNGEFIVDEAVKDIREKMILSGELTEVGENKNITIPKYSEEACSLGYSRLIGINDSNIRCDFVGITRIYENQKSEKWCIVHNRVDCLEYLEWLYKNVVWTQCNNLGQYEIFDSTINKVPYQSWSDKPNKAIEYHIGRMSLYNGMYEYWLLKFKNGIWYQAPFSSVLREFKEERRIFLALRKINKNAINANFEYKGKVVILNLFCRLPLKEEIMLDTFCWPQKRFNDKLNYVVPYKIWDGIKEVLESDLGIDMREKM